MDNNIKYSTPAIMTKYYLLGDMIRYKIDSDSILGNTIDPALDKAFNEFITEYDKITGITPKKEAPAPKKEAPAPKKEAPAPKKEAPAPKKEAPAPKKEAPAPKKEALAPKEDDAVTAYSQIKDYPSVNILALGKDYEAIDNTHPIHIINGLPNFPEGESLATARGIHPFFRGSASYLVYLPRDERRQFLSALVDGSCKEYDTTLSTFSLSAVNDMVKNGIDPDVLGSLMVSKDKSIFDVTDALPEPKIDPKFSEMMMSDKARKQMLNMLQKITPEYPMVLFAFLTANNYSKDVLKVIKQIADAHSKDPNPFVGYKDVNIEQLEKLNDSISFTL